MNGKGSADDIVPGRQCLWGGFFTMVLPRILQFCAGNDSSFARSSNSSKIQDFSFCIVGHNSVSGTHVC